MKIDRKECRKLLMWKIFTSMPRQHFFIKLFSLRCHFARLHADDNVLLLQLEEMRLMKIFCVKTCRSWLQREKCPWNTNAAEMLRRDISATRNMNCCEHLPSQICVYGDALIQNRRILISRYQLQSELSKEEKKGRSYSKQRKLTSLITMNGPTLQSVEMEKFFIKCYWYTWNCSLQAYASCFWNHNRGHCMAMSFPEIVWFYKWNLIGSNEKVWIWSMSIWFVSFCCCSALSVEKYQKLWARWISESNAIPLIM